MKRKTVSKYVFSGDTATPADVIIEIDSNERGDLNKEAVFLHQVLFDNLPEETYDELARLMKEMSK